jgi:hypothetical protein
MTATAELTKEDAITTTELAGGYDAYTDAAELGDALLLTEGYARAEPTTTVLTTSLHCGNTES